MDLEIKERGIDSGAEVSGAACLMGEREQGQHIEKLYSPMRDSNL